MRPEHSFKMGDILYVTWGYEQTNVDFFQVTSLPSPAFVSVRKIASVLTESAPLAMSGTAMPVKDHFVSQALRVRVVRKYRSDPTSPEAVLTEHGRAALWDGQPVSVSWYG